jgi:hypothetical protein
MKGKHMFEKIIVDLNAYGGFPYEDGFVVDHREQRLFPFVYLIAEKVLESGSNNFINDSSPRNTADFIERVAHIREGRPHFFDYAIAKEGVLFTVNQQLKAEILTRTGLTAENSILILAAAGLDVSIPNINLNIARSDEIKIIKEKLSHERHEYLHAISKMADETFNRLKNSIYTDTVDWALNEAYFKIKPKAEKFNEAMIKLDKKTLERAAVSFFKEIPTIGSVFVDKGIKEAGKKSLSVMIEILCKNLAKTFEERKVPEVVYGYKVNKSLNKMFLLSSNINI